MLTLKVPLKEAELFDKYFSNLNFSNPKFTLLNDDFVILHLDILNPTNKVYSPAMHNT